MVAVPESEPVIVFCPLCCTAQDVVAVEGQVVELDCVPCGQSWSMSISLLRFAEHAIT